jgi:hypothetical protein
MRPIILLGLLMLGACDELEDTDKNINTDFSGEVTDKDSFDLAFIDKYCDAWDTCEMAGECQQNNSDNTGCSFQQEAADDCLAPEYTCSVLGPEIPAECLAVCG